MHVDQSERDAQDGVRYTAVFAGDRKNDLNPHEPISSEAHAFLKGEVNRVYALFVETVARNRGIDASAVRDTEAGLFFGQAAVAIGLADAIGTFDDALAQLCESVSPLPKLAASHSGLFSNPQMESSMNDRTDPAAPDRPLADPAGSSSQPAAATAMTVADAIEVAQTCTLAGRTDLIAGFLEAKAPPAKVRSQLLATQAEASPEIVSRIDPQSAMSASSTGHPASPHNPLIQAVKSRLGTK
jgi:ClpP class serine protease